MSALVEAMEKAVAAEYGFILVDPLPDAKAVFARVALACLRAMAEVEPSEAAINAWCVSSAHDPGNIGRHFRAMLRQAVAEAEKGRET